MDNREKDLRIVRSIPTNFETRADGEKLSIEGYFAVFDSIYNVGEGMTESIQKGAFASSMDNDVRALINHDTTLVLGRTKAGTLKLREDDRGLWGHIDINPNDGDAMNLYERVKRGDVDQCSFGFNIVSERADVSEQGSCHWTIEEVDLHEVSACKFPAYEETSISARSKDLADMKARELEAWKARMKERFDHGIKSFDPS